MGSQIRGLGVSFCAFPLIQVLPAILFSSLMEPQPTFQANGLRNSFHTNYSINRYKINVLRP